jgi:hypothetical protein
MKGTNRLERLPFVVHRLAVMPGFAPTKTTSHMRSWHISERRYPKQVEMRKLTRSRWARTPTMFWPRFHCFAICFRR